MWEECRRRVAAGPGTVVHYVSNDNHGYNPRVKMGLKNTHWIPGPAPRDEVDFWAEERKIRRAVKLQKPFGAEKTMLDPALLPKVRPTYHLPECPVCKRTIRHYGRCAARKTFSLKPSKTWNFEETRDET